MFKSDQYLYINETAIYFYIDLRIKSSCQIYWIRKCQMLKIFCKKNTAVFFMLVAGNFSVQQKKTTAYIPHLLKK